MAQAQIDKVNLNKKKCKSTSTQTGYDYEFSLCLGNAKRVRFYYSESYKDYVISFNYGSCKKFIINRAMWHLFKNHFEEINKIFHQDNE